MLLKVKCCKCKDILHYIGYDGAFYLKCPNCDFSVIVSLEATKEEG